MASAPTANEIKTQLAALLTPVIGTSLTKKVRIHDQMVMAFKPVEGEDPSVLRSALDVATLEGGGTVKRVNCLMISEAGFTSGTEPRDSSRQDDRARPSRTIVRQFRLTYFYQFGVNSENTFSTNVEVIRQTIESEPQLGFALIAADHTAGQGSYIEGHDELQMPVMLPDAFGDVICHVAEGILTVRVNKSRLR